MKAMTPREITRSLGGLGGIKAAQDRLSPEIKARPLRLNNIGSKSRLT